MVHESLQLFLGFHVQLVVVLRAHAVAVGEAIQRHQHHRDPDRRLDREDEVEEEEWIAVPWMDEVQGVQPDPQNHDPGLGEDEHPTADQPREIVGDAVSEGEPALDLAVEVADRGMVVLMLDQVPGDVFDFSADRHGSFLWAAAFSAAATVRLA
jgi:hypothetical protein